MTDEQITKAAREICSLQAQKDANSDASECYLNGNYDHTIWMRLVEQGIRKGIEQHEAFKQEVSDIVYAHVNATNETSADAWEKLKTLIIPKPKPDPLVEAYLSVYPHSNTAEQYMAPIRAALDDLGFEIREKNDG